MQTTNEGSSVANFTIATTDFWKGKDGVSQEKTEWHRIVAFGRLAEVCGEYLFKGKPVYIEGRIQYREWKRKDGNKGLTWKIVASQMQML